VVFLPYNYLLDMRTSDGVGDTIRWKNAIIILDEAHNVNVSGKERGGGVATGRRRDDDGRRRRRRWRRSEN
jgi:hypothetical protein